jgi:hypothetical protein
MSTARIKQISGVESGPFAPLDNVAVVGIVAGIGPASTEIASTGLPGSNGVMAADTAALVPNFNASRRLILLI